MKQRAAVLIIILSLGAIVVPVHALLKAEEIAYVLRDSGATMLICGLPASRPDIVKRLCSSCKQVLSDHRDLVKIDCLEAIERLNSWGKL